MLGNSVASGIIFLVASFSFADVDFENEPNVVCGPQQAEDTASNDNDPLPSEVERGSTGVVEYLLEVVEPVVDFQHNFNV